MIRGLDASAVQGALPYGQLGPEYRFVILKAQQGNDGFDPWFERNVKGALDAGLEPFAYCFTYPLPHLDPKEQAALFVSRTEQLLPGRPIFLDNEWPEVVAARPGGKGWKEWGCSPQQLSDWLAANAAEVTRLSRAPAIYTYDWWWRAIRDGAPAYGFPTGADVSWAAAYDLWMAWYVSGWPAPGASPKVPAPWATWKFWQFDGNGGLRLPNGVDADFCVFNGSDDDLKAWALGTSPPPAPSIDVTTVRGIQARLAALGFDPGPIDGIDGPKTDAAIRAFQAARGLAVDGIVGPQTRAALLAPASTS